MTSPPNLRTNQRPPGERRDGQPERCRRSAAQSDYHAVVHRRRSGPGRRTLRSGHSQLPRSDPRNASDADEVAQEFALHVLNHKFDKASPDRGRFRDYVKVSARNAALMYVRKKKRAGHATALTIDLERNLSNPADRDRSGGGRERRLARSLAARCLIDKVWRSLESRELLAGQPLFHGPSPLD